MKKFEIDYSFTIEVEAVSEEEARAKGQEIIETFPEPAIFLDDIRELEDEGLLSSLDESDYEPMSEKDIKRLEDLFNEDPSDLEKRFPEEDEQLKGGYLDS